MRREEVVAIVKPYPVGKHLASLVVVIPKEVRERLKIRSREKFYVKTDGIDRIIYERVDAKPLDKKNSTEVKKE